MIVQSPVRPHAQGKPLSEDADKFGSLRDSSSIVNDVQALRERMEQDGYLFLPGYLDRDEVLTARREIMERVAAEGALQAGIDMMDGLLNPDVDVRFRPDLTRKSRILSKLLFDGRMMQLYERFLDGSIRHLDFIWLRAVSPGLGTAPHGDSVFMNRGTTQLYTSWTPLGDIDTRLGGLIILENSHKLEHIKGGYGQRDVDTYCEDDPDAEEYRTTGKWQWNGQLSDDPVELRNQLGGRWLTANYRAGDLLVFSIYTLHASLDNQSENQLRVSTDTRYQLASEPVDERWIGENPTAHGPGAKKGIIC